MRVRGRDGVGVRVRCRYLALTEGQYIYAYLERWHLLDEIVRGLVDLLHRVGRNLQMCGDGESGLPPYFELSSAPLFQAPFLLCRRQQRRPKLQCRRSGPGAVRRGTAVRRGSARLSLDVRPCGEGHAREVACVLEEELRGGEGGEHGLAQAARGRAEGFAEGVVPVSRQSGGVSASVPGAPRMCMCMRMRLYACTIA